MGPQDITNIHDTNGQWVAVDASDIGGISGFRPTIFATYSNNFFMFSSIPGDDGTTLAATSKWRQFKF